MVAKTINVRSSRGEGLALNTRQDPTVVYIGAGMLRFPSSGTVAAAGSAQGDGTVLVPGITIVSGADGTKGVTLTAPNADQYGGEVYILKNTAGSTLKIYPPTGGSINAIAVNGNYVLATLTSCILVNSWSDKTVTGGTWYSIPLLGS